MVNLMELGFIPVGAITVICILVAQAIKATGLKNKWIPVICGALGGALGVIGMATIKDFPATDILTAISVGIVSGFAATGIHQAKKQLKKDMFN